LDEYQVAGSRYQVSGLKLIKHQEQLLKVALDESIYLSSRYQNQS